MAGAAAGAGMRHRVFRLSAGETEIKNRGTHDILIAVVDGL